MDHFESSHGSMSDSLEEASELEKLIHQCEFENQQYVNLIEKEKQLIKALAREIEAKTDETERLQDAIAQLDTDTKLFHKQFTVNRDNCENLKKTSQVLTEHVAAMTNQLEMIKQKRKLDGEEHERLMQHYSNMWQDYKAKYEKWPQVQSLREQQVREETARAKTERAKEKLDELRRKIEEFDSKNSSSYMKTLLIRVAESYVRCQQIIKEIVIKRKDLERRKKEEEVRQKEATEAINKQLQESHIHDQVSGKDEMETSHTPSGENEEMTSPMISVFSGRSDPEEEMQTGDTQAVARVEQERAVEGHIIQCQDQQTPRKPQTWLENYQEQNQKHQPKARGPVPISVPHNSPPHFMQKPQAQHNELQPPFVTFHNAVQEQGLEDMEATVSIYLPARSGDKPIASDAQIEDNKQSKLNLTTCLLPSTSETSTHLNIIGFTNPAFQPSPTAPKFTVPVMPTRQSTHVPAHVQSSQRPTMVPQLVVMNRPSFQPCSTSQITVRPQVSSCQSSKIPTVSKPHQKFNISTVPSVHAHTKQSLENLSQRLTNANPLQIPPLKTVTNIANVNSPAIGPVQRFLIRPQSSNFNQNQIVVGHTQHQTVSQLQSMGCAAHGITQLGITSVPKCSSGQISQNAFNVAKKSSQPNGSLIQSPDIQTLARPQIASTSSFGNQRFISSSPQEHTESPSVAQQSVQQQRTSSPLQAISASRSDAQRGRRQECGGLQTTAAQQIDNCTATSGSKTPLSSPVPMTTSLCINSEDIDTTRSHTSEPEIPHSEGGSGSPFNFEEHRQKLKDINKSPGQPMFTAGRRMFEGAKGDNEEQDKSGLLSQIFNKTSTFTIFGGGDGFQFPSFEPAEDKTNGLSDGKPDESRLNCNTKDPSDPAKKFPSLFGSPDSSGKPTSNSVNQEAPSPEKDKADSFGNINSKDKEANNSAGFSFNFDLFGVGPQSSSIEEGTDESTGFSLDFGQDSKEPPFNFNLLKEPSCNFDFGSFGCDPKSPSDGLNNTNIGGGPKFEEMFGSNSNNASNNGFKFSFNFLD